MAELKCPLRSNCFFTRTCLKEQCAWYVLLYKNITDENGQSRSVGEGRCGLPYSSILLCEALNLLKK